MSESRLAEDVRAALEEATAGLRAPAGAAARARSRARRRRAAYGLLAIVPAVGVIAGLTVAAHGGAPAPGITAAPPAPAIQTDAYVVSHIEAALRGANDYIIVTSASSGSGQVTTAYEDPVTGTTRSVVSGSGHKVAYWIKTTVSGGADHWHTTYVDYANRTWWAKSSQSGKLGQATSDAIVLSAQTTPGELSKALATGQVRIGLKGQVNGHAAIELVYAGKLSAKASAVHYWVDAKTFQPVRIDLPPFTAASTITESWIPKSAALVRQTNTPQVPAGFRKVPASPAFN